MGELFLWNDICFDRTVASARVVTTSCLALEAGDVMLPAWFG